MSPRDSLATAARCASLVLAMVLGATIACGPPQSRTAPGPGGGEGGTSADIDAGDNQGGRGGAASGGRGGATGGSGGLALGGAGGTGLGEGGAIATGGAGGMAMDAAADRASTGGALGMDAGMEPMP